MNELQQQTIESYNKSAGTFADSIAKLKNYHHTYDFLIGGLPEPCDILDLACGPAQISQYIRERIAAKIVGVDLSHGMLNIARKAIPDGEFVQHSIIDYYDERQYDAVIIGFGIPYLDTEQMERCLANACRLVKREKYLYVSFMQGNQSRIEKTSFGGSNEFLIFYHDKETVKNILTNNGMSVAQEFALDYHEPDGSVTTDVVYIAKRSEKYVSDT
ncbi:hypothetical protein U14_04701 [Candidatus Moduliflexus flocculans]|uniref:Methyltransferase domain-containing protein n=1 Tax=Candidatus Moduliflexus flocculans TaxID=1499966 RepID=A0A0S6W4V9_9BACT|nr:hypothetical protein U14_04701 [Candidatus Moduliflexus flocculans]